MSTTTPLMASVSLNWIDVEAVARHVLALLQKDGELALTIVGNVLKLVKAVTGRDMMAVFATLNAETVDVQKLIADVKAEFGLN